MDLQISVFLLFILFTAGTETDSVYNGYKYGSFWPSHYCYECKGLTDSCVKTPVLCPTGFYKCQSSTSVTQIGDITTEIQKEKGCSAGCRTGSLRLSYVKLSISCCGTSFCNARDAPDPRTNTPNGNKCYYCDHHSCSNILSCSGSEDRCVTATGVTSRGTSGVVKGCASKSFCDIPTSTDLTAFSCCEGNLCNGDRSVSQGVTQSSMNDGDKSVTQSSMNDGDKSVTQSSMNDGDKSVTQSSMNDGDKSVTQSSMYDGDISVTQSFIQSFMDKGVKRATQSFIHYVMQKGAKMVTQSSTSNSAQSVSQSFLFLCCSLLFLLHTILF